MNNHTQEPWDNGTAVLVEAGTEGVRLGKGLHPPAVDCRVLSEPNYQRALVCVNALAGVDSPAVAIQEAIAALESTLVLWDFYCEVTDTYCQLCDGVAPKRWEGNQSEIVGAVKHDDECAFPKVKDALSKLRGVKQ